MKSVLNAVKGLVTLLVVGCCVTEGVAAPPARWISRGVGGGGAFYGPSISPHDPSVIFVQSDMSDFFRTTTGGRTWETLDWRQIQGGNYGSAVQFTSNTQLVYAVNFIDETPAPYRSFDAGRTWIPLATDPTGGGAYCLYADPANTNRLITADYSNVYFSNDGGQSFALRITSADCHVAGVFFDGNQIFVGTRAGLYVSTDNGASFTPSAVSGIPGTQAMVSFAGARQGGVVRLFCVTLGSGDVYPGITGADHAGYAGVYRLDYGSGSWTGVSNGLGSDHPFFVGMCRTNINVAYVAGAMVAESYPVVYRTSNGGTSWQQVFWPVNNQNIQTGWQGQGGDRAWDYGEYALGFAVCGLDANRAIITDLGGAHMTTNGGVSWAQVYTHQVDQHPANAATPARSYYHASGLEDTTCWWVNWSDATNLFAGFTDIRACRSVDAGVSWSFDYSGLTANTCYQCIRQPSNGRLYASISSIHDMFQSTYLQDSKIDGGTGGILYSVDKGATWVSLHDFGHPVTGLALHPTDSNRLYACVVDSLAGGIFVTSNLLAGGSSTWVKLPNPPRTEGHPWTIQVLNDGTLVSSYSGRRNPAGAFTASAGVFVSTNNGASWLDRSPDPWLRYWVKDVVVDPYDPAQQRWYACAFNIWGSATNEIGGLYRTTNRGVSWTCISSGIRAVESCGFIPQSTNELFLTTEAQGLFYSQNINSATPLFTEVLNYPFKHPLRVLSNPYNTNELWVTSFGNGLRVGKFIEPRVSAASVSWTNGTVLRVDVSGETGQQLVLRASTNLVVWQDLVTNAMTAGACVFSDTNAAGFSSRFYQILSE